MSGLHTKARLAAGTMPITLGGTKHEYHVAGIEGTKRAIAITGKCGDEHDALSAADAERIAACWNACDSLTQDHFDGGWTAKGLSKHAHDKEEALAAARALLLDIQAIDRRGGIAEHAEGEPCTSRDFDALMLRVNDLLKGGAQ